MPVEIQCQFCGQPFSVPPKRASTAKFCSRDCKWKWQSENMRGKNNPTYNSIVVNCDNCGKSIEKPPNNIKRSTHLFCNPQCHGEWKSKNLLGDKAPNYSRVTVYCDFCHKPIERNPYRLENQKWHFCGFECYGAWRAQTLVGEASPTYIGPQPVTCCVCGKDFTVPNHQLKKNRHFCGSECWGKWLSDNVNGERHHNYRGGTIRYYGPNWQAQRRKARKRADYRCEICGISEKTTKRQHQVHHVIPFRTFGYIPDVNDHYKTANALSNLICLCYTCHQHAERGKVAFQPYLL